MINLLDLTFDELLSELELPKYRVQQIFQWLHRSVDFDGMSNIPASLRDGLKQKYMALPCKIVQTLRSKDKTEKYLFELCDGNIIEGVLMSYKHGNTLCVSTQVGCRMGCAFCASGIGGLVRNLSCGEICGQVIAVNALGGGGRHVTNLVLMGSGEPLDNYDNVTKFIRLITAEQGINISQRNISLSTCGLADKIVKLADDGFSVNLSISLHATRDEKRREVMPVANKYSIAEVIGAARYYFNKNGRRVIIEYSLIRDENDRESDATRLYAILKGLNCHVNLILLNVVKENSLKPASRVSAEKFSAKLTELGISNTIRRSMGSDIEGACGQLRSKYISNEE